MSESSFEWFVQMAGGMVLGPMPREDLTGLAESGGLLPDDLVREGESGSWRPASRVAGLLPRVAGNSLVPAESPDDADFELQPGLQLIDDPLEVEALSREESGPAGLPKPSPRVPQKTESPPTTASTEPVDDPSSDVDPLAEEDLLDESMFDHTLLADVHESPFSDEDDSSPDLLKSERPPVEDEVIPRPIECRKPAAAPRSERPADGRSPAMQTGKKVAGTAWSFLPRSLRRKAIFAVIGAVVFAVLTLAAPELLPSDEPLIYESLASIHDDLLAFDSGEIDPSEWTEFSQRAGDEVEFHLPWLEENAVPGERGRLLLLYVTRDLEEMLQSPPGTERPHQKRVEGFFQQLDELYASTHD